ncbi:hypothetical protein M9H77_04813 [Catharanthus roseus]|uniref:Uncharacterized protein n=1 Tax=Catharanthus roseus TaxID=4058 RepID=A0ACC0CF84_CATRO|nr:hypothetical protein M9H77_04813 [Catharanthus roseus]
MNQNGVKKLRRLFLPMALAAHSCIMSNPPPIPVARFYLTRSASISFFLRHQLPSSPPLRSTMTTTVIPASDSTNLDAIFKQKKALRTKVRRDLKSMDSDLRSQEDDAIQNIVLEAPWFKSCKRLCAYISCSALREVDTSRLLSEILKKSSEDGHPQMGKTLYVPRVEDKNSYMRMLNISRMDDLVANSMNILEPAPTDVEGNEREDVMLANDPVDILVLPGLAFDRSGRRLGRGGGYYDTFLRKYLERAREQKWKQPLLVALSYSLQILDEGIIPITPNDMFVDALVSPSGVIPISPFGREYCCL